MATSTPLQSSNPKPITIMAISLPNFLSYTLFLLGSLHHVDSLMLTIFNNCPFTIWPAIQPNTGSELLEQGGFCLQTLSYRSFDAPASPWSGRIWARTLCTTAPDSHFTCATGDCGTHRVECSGSGGSTPATLAQFTLQGQNGLSIYGVSLVDGYNLPMTVTPHEGRGTCPVVGCMADLLSTCPRYLQIRCPEPNGPVVGCKSGCEAYGTDELCCRGKYSGSDTCKANEYSSWFKDRCPATFTFAHDTPSLVNDCYEPRELKVIFCQ